MRSRTVLFTGLLVALAAARSWSATPPPAPTENVRRFALVIGANNGSRERQALRYAVSDAQKIMDVLQKIGGVLPADSVLLVEPSRLAVLNGFSQLTPRLQALKAQAKKTELIFYYSGHSDEEAVLLHGEKVYYRELRDWLNRLPADVRIAILDSCSSGAFTRLKGGTVRPPFLEDTAYNMKGFAIMTSSSGDEASQESDKLQSSFFTYYLVMGLRGAADLAQNGRVTLSEAYQYAYSETLAKTERTLSGPQHPNYDIQMSGTGDVVMTELRNASAVLTLDKTVSGRISIRDARGQLVMELHKPAARDMQIGLEPGDFTLTEEQAGKLAETRIHPENGQTLLVTQDRFKETPREYTVPRGNPDRLGQKNESRDAEDKAGGYTVRSWDFSWFPEQAQNQKVIHHFVFNALGSYSAKLRGLAFGLGPCLVADGEQGAEISLLGNQLGGRFEGIQISGLFNFCTGSLRGAQVTAGANVFRGDLVGPQGAGLFNVCHGNLQGPQVAGLGNYSRGTLLGPQVAAVCNILEGEMQGPQVSAVFNYADHIANGSQVTSGFNYVLHQCAGAQVAEGFNYAQNLSGVQVAPLNICEKSEGLQVGLFNLTEQQDGESIGLFNLAKNGSLDWVTWWDTLTPLNTGVRFRVNHFYSCFAIGGHEFFQDPVASVHLGVHIPIRDCYVDADWGWLERFAEFGLPLAAQGRLIAGYSPLPFFSVQAGGGVTDAYTGAFGLTPGRFSPLLLAGLQFTL